MEAYASGGCCYSDNESRRERDIFFTFGLLRLQLFFFVDKHGTRIKKSAY